VWHPMSVKDIPQAVGMGLWEWARRVILVSCLANSPIKATTLSCTTAAAP
jgi:hypothetical protein